MKKGVLRRTLPPIAATMLAVLLAVPTVSAVVIDHLNPDFEAFPRTGDAPLEVRFENWTTAGTAPYVRAEWDFDCDGVIEKTLTGAKVMDDVNWTYTIPGVYSVSLTMTDSTPPYNNMGPFVHTETKHSYITVLPFDPWAYDINGNGIIEKSEAILAIQHYFGGKITKEQAIEVIMLYF